MAGILGQLLVELGINSVAFKAGCDKATYLGKQLSNDLKKSFSEVGASFSQLGTMLGGSLGPVGGVIASTVKGFETIGVAAKAAGAGAPGLLAVAGAIGGIGLVAAGAAVGLVELAKGGAEVIEQLNLLSQKTGISVRDLQTLKAMGDVVNVPVEQLAMGFRRFGKALAESGDTTKETSRMLHQLGVSSHEPYAAFVQLAEGISKIQDPNERAAEATKLLGMRVAQSLLPDLEKGAAGIEKYKSMVSQFGAEIGPEQIARQEKYKDSQEELSLSWDRLKVSASWALPYMKAFNEVMAETVAHPFGIGFGAAPKVNPEDAAKQQAKQQSLDTSFAQAAAELKVYQQIKAQTAAAYELQSVQEQIKDSLDLHTAAGNKEAAQLESQIPMLERKAQLSKEAAEALRSLPETTKKAIDGEDVKVTSAYVSAVKALGPAHAEEARALEVNEAVQKFVNEQKEKGIANDTRAIAAAAQYRTSVEAVTLATTELGKATEAGKMIQEFAEHTKEATRRSDELAGKHGELAKIEAELQEGLDKSMRALVAETTAYNAHKAAVDGNVNATDDERAQLVAEGKLIDAHVTAVNADAAAIDELIRKKQTAAIVDANDALTQRIADIRMETDLLGTNSEAETKNMMSLEKTAEKLFGVGAAAKSARDAYIALHASEISGETKEEKTQTATKTGQSDAIGPAREFAALALVGQQLQKNKDAWQAMASQELQDAGVSKMQADAMAANQFKIALQGVTTQLLEMKAKGGDTIAAVGLGFQKFIQESSSAGQAISQNINKALDGVAAGLAKSIMAGKGFGVAMRQVAKEAATEFIEMEIKRLMSSIMIEAQLTVAHVTGNESRALSDKATAMKSILASAKTAASKGWNAGMNFPFPVDLIMAPTLAAAAFTGTMAYAAFEQGGIVQNTGMAKVHENEMVLPRPISEKVQKMADGGGKGGSMTVHYSPTVHAVDGKGVGDMLNAHGQLFTQHLMKEMRRRNMA